MLAKRGRGRFKIEDPFNGNIIEGIIYKNSDFNYGTLDIEYVNGEYVPQTIRAMPKLQYPFKYGDDTVKFIFPDEFTKIEVYEKIDGTNIFGYIYHDAAGDRFVTFKTRLTPVVQGNSYGDFLTMWQRILKKYPDISQFILDIGLGVAFEMYGRENTIIVDYPDVRLDAKLLCIRDNEGNVYSPTLIKEKLDDYKIPCPPTLITEITSDVRDISVKYQEIVDYLNKHIRVKEEFKDQKSIIGLEGTVWYPIDVDFKLVKWKHGLPFFKCKPDIIRDLHWKGNMRVIPKHSIYITCKNAFEQFNIPTVEDIKELLLEEFSKSLVEASTRRIERILSKVIGKAALREEIIEVYNKEHSKDPGFDINKDKGKVMRHFASLGYSKDSMKEIFSILRDTFME